MCANFSIVLVLHFLHQETFFDYVHFEWSQHVVLHLEDEADMPVHKTELSAHWYVMGYKRPTYVTAAYRDLQAQVSSAKGRF